MIKALLWLIAGLITSKLREIICKNLVSQIYGPSFDVTCKPYALYKNTSFYIVHFCLLLVHFQTTFLSLSVAVAKP